MGRRRGKGGAGAGTARRPAPGSVGRRRRYHHGDLRRALLDAAVRLVETGGAEALTLREAARRAGVSQAAPYRHFADKEALLAAVAEEGFRTMTAEMRQAMAARGDDPVGRLQAVGLAYVAFATGHPAHFRLMFGRGAASRVAHPALREAANQAFDLLVGAIAAGQRAGFVRAGAPESLALAAWAAVHGLSALLVDGQLAAPPGGSPEARTVDDLAHAVTGYLFFGLAAPPDPAGAGPGTGGEIPPALARMRHGNEASAGLPSPNRVG